jgi:hypothetical protein
MPHDPNKPDDGNEGRDPAATDHPTGEKQAAENDDNELAG